MDNHYQPGHCNIGQKEIALRKKFFRFFAAFALFLTFAGIAWCYSIFVWIALLISVFAVIVIHLEIRYRFCILFGFFGLYNFDKLGVLHEVTDRDDARQDRRRVLQIVIESLVVSLAYASIIHLAATYVHGS